MFERFSILTVALLLVPAALSADTYNVDRTHSEVSFRVRHLVSHVPGNFSDYEGTIELDPKNLESSKVEFVIQAKSIKTGNTVRDEHLRSEDFFWVDQYPTLSFRSGTIRAVGADKFDVTGTLSIRGVEKIITVPVEFLGFIKDPWGGRRAGFETTFTINRKDYGIEWNEALDTGGVLLGDEVTITLNLELLEQK